jgi:hypothetical protein
MVDILEKLQGPRTPQGGLWSYPNLHDEAADEITRLREENARLREALEPFAKAADCCEDKSHIDYGSVRIDHLRAARAAIL